MKPRDLSIRSMDDVIASALIGAAATAVSVGATVAVAYGGFRFGRDSNQKAINAAHDDAREGQLTDRYIKAVEQLGSDKPDVRIGGIYALDRIAHDSEKDHPTVMQVLTAFVREHSHEPRNPSSTEHRQSTLPDVQAAIRVIGLRNTNYDKPGGLDLTAADLTDAVLDYANFSEAWLEYAIFVHASLPHAKFIKARLHHANFTRANLTEVDFTEADLTEADFTDLDLTAAKFTGAKLGGAKLDGAKWSKDVPDPEGWSRDTGSGRLNPAKRDVNAPGNRLPSIG